MAEVSLVKTGFHEGVWEGVLTTADPDEPPPDLSVTHLERPLDGVSVVPNGSAGSFTVRIPVPPELLSEGVQTVLIAARDTGERLGHFTVVTGEPLEDDIRGELDLLRAELDMLKKAFRRHCLETM